MLIDILKILFCAPFLLYSCYSDIKTRRVSDKVWYIMLGGGAFFILYEFADYGLFYLFRLFISAVLMYLFLEIYSRLSTFFNIRMMGGADAKLLLVLSIFFPIYPSFNIESHIFPLNLPFNFFAFSVLNDAVTVAIIIPIGFAAYNLIKLGFRVDKAAYIFMGYKTKISELSDKHVWIIQDFEDDNGKIKSFYKRGGIEIDEKSISKLKNLLKKGLIKDEVWITPKLPFMIPLTLGFFLAIFYGDLIFEIIKNLLLHK
ncbi:MAG: prepilin peptidase [Candidatus Methanoperedens sp.]|nr:prepilin peptidase [Candidatus Methanoperedens sp.]